ncbi:CD40 ligand [Aplochiton taeniatus]
MINTYQTSLAAPPPIPPRLSRSGTVLVPASASSLGKGKHLLRFLVGIVLLHLLLSLGGFFYFYRKEKKDTFPQAEERAGHLKWNMRHSVRQNINFFKASWLTVVQPGDYYIYSQVTFSKWNPKLPLASMVQLRETETGEEKAVMKAYCALANRTGSMCTASQSEVLTLKSGNQLSVWVIDLSLVDYEREATTFGMYKL